MQILKQGVQDNVVIYQYVTASNCPNISCKAQRNNYAAITEPAEVAELLRAIDAFKGDAVVRFFCYYFRMRLNPVDRMLYGR